jgi:hypothetical protein
MSPRRGGRRIEAARNDACSVFGSPTPPPDRRLQHRTAEDTRMQLGTKTNWRGKIREGKTTSVIERVTARAPSQLWLWLAGGSIAASITLFMKGRKQAGLLVGLWPPTFLIMGNYNKMVKSLGTT